MGIDRLFLLFLIVGLRVGEFEIFSQSVVLSDGVSLCIPVLLIDVLIDAAAIVSHSLLFVLVLILIKLCLDSFYTVTHVIYCVKTSNKNIKFNFIYLH